MQLEFITLDVFTERKFGGNPLAVVLNARGLKTEQMQAIAGEFNLAETTFVLPPQDAAHTAEVRIFTPRAELPFAGHPNIGTAFVLASAGQSYGRAVGDPLVFEEKAGLVRLDLLKDGTAVVGARLDAAAAADARRRHCARYRSRGVFARARRRRNNPITSPASPRAAFHSSSRN